MSTEDSIHHAIAAVSDIHIKDIRLIKDKLTGASRGFCFVETNTLEEAGELMKSIHQQVPAFFVDTKRVNALYSRQNTSQPKPCSNAKAAAAIEQAQAMVTMYRNQRKYPLKTTDSSNVQPTNISSTESTEDTSQQANNSGLPSTYVYDTNSGYYYDTITGLYYDPSTQYHYNGQTGQYCYYDSTKQAYIPVNADGTPITDSGGESSTIEKKKKESTTISNSKSAKKIAKDMERWAKSVNIQKQVQQNFIQQMTRAENHTTTTQEMTSNEDHHVPSIHEDQVTPSSLIDSNPSSSSSLLHSSSSTASDEYIDMDQLACLLCKRKFSNSSQLMKHVQFSDLHKQNLEKEKQPKPSPSPAPFEMQYRDRAKERRDKFGMVAIVPGWKKRFELERGREEVTKPTTTTRLPEPPTTPEVTIEKKQNENIGSKLLKAMGWSEGEGLGKANQGITAPIEADHRAPAAGLGSAGSNYGTSYTGSSNYRENVRSVARARFQQMFQNK